MAAAPGPRDGLVISVVIPSYGGENRLRPLLGQLREQDFREPFEIVVVDDGSPRPLEAALGDILDRSQKIRIVRQENAGGPAARNRGAASARGQFLLFVDDDMEVGPEFVRVHLEVQREVGPGVVSAHFENRLSGVDSPFGRWYRAQTNIWESASRRSWQETAPGVFRVPPMFASTGNLSVPRETFEAGGGFDAGYSKPGVEDMDLGLRLGTQGVPVFRTDRTLPRHNEERSDIRRFCERQRVGAMVTVKLLQRFPEFGRPFHESNLHRVNGPVLLGGEPFVRSAGKLAKGLAVLPPLWSALLAVTRFVEAVAPETGLPAKLYDALVGAAIQKGWREGLRTYAPAGPDSC